MSANSIKQERINAREEKLNRKAQAAKEAEKARAKERTGWIIGAVVLVLVVLFGIFVSTGSLYRSISALKIRDKTYSSAEVTYYYANEYWQFVQSYGSFASYMGLDVNSGISSLGDQAYTAGDEYATWKDYFLRAAETNLAAQQALGDYATENGVTLTEEDYASVDADLASLEESVVSGGYKNLDMYFSIAYGKGVNRKIAREAALLQKLASKAYDYASSQFTYTDEELSEYYDSLEGENDKYDYWYYFAAAEKEYSEPDEDGNVTSEVTEQTMADAQLKAQKVVTAFKGDDSTEDFEERLNAAVGAEFEGASCVVKKNTTASSITDDFKDWMTDPERTAGDITVIPNVSETGYYIVVFGRYDDNHYPTVSVRHILIKAVPEEDGSYSDLGLEEAKVKAEGIYTQWKNGEATEESFAALANEYSEDDGSNTNGGLYENIYKGQMVDSFDEFCFAGHKHGDTDMVAAASSTYAGYHIIYYVGEGELYSNYIARIKLSSDDTEAWYSALTEPYEPVRLAGFKQVAK